MQLDEIIDELNKEIERAEEQINDLANSEHALYTIGKLVGFVKAKSLVQRVDLEGEWINRRHTYIPLSDSF